MRRRRITVAYRPSSHVPRYPWMVSHPRGFARFKTKRRARAFASRLQRASRLQNPSGMGTAIAIAAATAAAGALAVYLVQRLTAPKPPPPPPKPVLDFQINWPPPS